MDSAFYHTDGDIYVATPTTRGPWDNRFQHGGPPSALMAGAMARLGEDAGAFAMARVTVELLRPVPIGEVTVSAGIDVSGRTVQRLRADLSAGGTVIARAWGVRIARERAETPASAPPALDWPDPDGVEPFVFSFFQHEEGYHRGVDLRLAYGSWGATPVGFWARTRIPLVEGRDTLPIERLVNLADAQSGMGPPLDPLSYTFLNPDLTAYLAREPRGEWIGFDISAAVGPEGAGLSESAVRDRDGAFGRTAQSLVIRKRG
jgi:hypothetical protein